MLTYHSAHVIPDATPPNKRVLRPDQLAKLVRRLREHNVVLLRAPPMCGKVFTISLYIIDFCQTTLAEELRNYCSENHLKYFYLVTGRTEGDFNQHFLAQTGQSFWNLIEAKEETFIVLDEAQLFYETQKPMWEALATIVRASPTVRFLVIGTYYSPIQTRISPKLGEGTASLFLDFLLLDLESTQRLASKLYQSSSTPYPALKSEVVETVHTFTNGHPGISATVLMELLKSEQNNLQTSSWVKKLRVRRAFDWIPNMIANNPASVRMMHYLLKRTDIRTLRFNINNPVMDDETLQFVYNLEKAGLWCRFEPRLEPNQFTFTSRIGFDITFNSLSTGTMELDNTEESMETFITYCLQRIQLSTVPRKMLEKDWENAFYAATGAVTSHFRQSQYPIPGSQRRVDLWVDSGLNYAIEFSIDQKQAKKTKKQCADYIREHCECFQEKGKYALADFKHKRCLHFLVNHPTDEEIALLPNYEYLRYVLPATDLKTFSLFSDNSTKTYEFLLPGQ
jgi:hypothetical protein